MALPMLRNTPKRASMNLLSQASFLILTIAFTRIAVGADQALLRALDIGNQGVANLLTSDGAGNLFAIATFLDPSGLPKTRVIKTDPNGTPLATFDFAGQAPTQAATDPQGNLVVAGSAPVVMSGGNLLASNFPLVSPLFPSLNNGGAYVLKLDSKLQGIVFSTFLNTFSAANAVAVDPAGNIYVAGTTTAGNFPVTPGAYQTRPPNGDSYAFLTEISANGDKLLYSTYFGGDLVSCTLSPGTSVCGGPPAATVALTITVSTSGAILIGGETTATDLPVTAGVIGPACSCVNVASTGFLAEFAAGNFAKLAWSTFVNLGTGGLPFGPVGTFVDAAAFDPAGDAVIGGRAQLGLVTTTGALQSGLTAKTLSGGFLAKVTGSGTGLAWSTWLGGGPPDGSVETGFTSHVVALAVDPQGNIVATGFSQASQLPQVPGFPVLGPSYVARISGDGTSLIDLFAGPLNSASAGLSLTPGGHFASLGQSGAVWIETANTGPSLLAIANAASGPVSGLIVPTEIVSLYGAGIGPTAALPGQITGGVYSSSLGGYQLKFNGVSAPLLYAGPTQINALVPQSVSEGDSAHVQLVTPSGTVDGPTLAVRPAAPYVFQYGLAAPLPDGTTSLAAALNQDQSINSPENPAGPGQIVTMFVSGGGGLGDPLPDGTIVSGATLHYAALPVSVLSDPIGLGMGTSLYVPYAGAAPQEVYGLMQINVQLPEIFPTVSSSTFRFAIEIGGTVGGTASVAIAQ
jgi:uncharacterized protein (TIGR03437 family)